MAFCAYNTLFATRRKSLIARTMIGQTAADLPTHCVRTNGLLCLQYSLCNTTRISNCTKNDSTDCSRSTCDLTVCVQIAFCVYNTRFATRHESQIARRMVVQTACSRSTCDLTMGLCIASCERNNLFATRHGSQIAQGMIAQTAADPLATSPWAYA